MELISLTFGEYSLVYNMFSFSIAAMLAAGAFFILARDRVSPEYRISLVVSTLVVGIAAYHYFRITGSWASAFELSSSGKEYLASVEPFNDAYRYVDWLLTVPLLLVELVLVLNLSRQKSGPLLTKLVIAATFMIALGYPGELLSADSMFSERGFWGLLSTIPFVYILYILFGELGTAMEGQPERVRVLFRNIRLLLIFTWGFYPIVYMAPFWGLTGSASLVTIQVGYTIADVLAKAGYGVMIYAIAREKSLAEGYSIQEAISS